MKLPRKINMIKYTQYFSKWRNAWIEFGYDPTIGQVNEMLKYNYKLR